MRCRDVRERLDDFVDGRLSADDVTDLKRHLRECEGCREEERELRDLLARASSLMADAAPARDLWPEIRDRVERASVSAFFDARSWSTWRIAAAMAATILIVAVTATVFYRLGQGSTTDPARPVIETTPVAHQQAPSRPVQEQFDEARQELRGWLAQNRESLPPETLKRVEDNLRIIDDSITEIQAALDQNPASQELNRMLMAAYRQEVGLLRRVNAWYTRM